MAQFTNFATLSYSGGTTDSNTVTGELLEILSVAKSAVADNYTAGDSITYVISLINSGAVALTGLTVTDDLGGYSFGDGTVYPLAYAAGSVRYYINGVLQTAPTVTAGPPLVISGLNVPAGGNAMLVYEANVTNYAPLAAESDIVNTAAVTGGGLSAPLSATATVNAADGARLSVSKALCPATVTENGQITYTFVISNMGNAAATAADNAVLSDVFSPILDPIAVTFNGTAWTAGTNYTYDSATGAFATVAGQIVVPAATYTQNADGTWKVIPGTATVSVVGTV